MTTKQLTILLGAAAVLGGAALCLSSGSKPSGAKLNGKAIFPKLDISQVARVELGDKLKLASGEKGWTVETYHNYPADHAKLTENLLKLTELKVGQVSRGKKIENADVLTLKDASGKEVASLPLGEKHAKWGHGRYATFEGETVPLYFVSGTELGGDADFKKNIFAAVEEMKHKVMCDGVTLQNLRPDISFFLNGIFIGYMELKSVTNGQTARVQGRGKVIGDYLESVKGMAERAKAHPAALADRRETLWMFEKGIHLTATDVNETYVIRSIGAFYDDAIKGFADNVASIAQLKPDMEKAFKLYPITSELLSNKQRFVEVMHALYSKKMIEREILYYNFIEYKYVKKEGAKEKERTSNTGRLIAPRPKQKFGCDKIMGRITEMLDHEKEPGYYINKLRTYLQSQGITPQKIEEIILLRERYFNNKFVYSLLLQYAAGFGKSNIIGWTALRLKDFRYEGMYAYDKVMIVVDRLQLRDQLDTMMMNMNIDKSMFVEATDRDTFINALEGKLRIIVVNIQKFLDLQDALSAAGKKLKKMRVAFLIDEIHRSNSGENNQEMIDLFARLQETFNVGGQTVVKKNLLIGFTATPSEETLAKFGEFRSALTKPMWIPFDCYTMREAIEDGYILDPTKAIIPYAVPVDFELPEELRDSDEDDINDGIFRLMDAVNVDISGDDVTYHSTSFFRNAHQDY